MAMEFIASQRHFARPYSELAPRYDTALGISNFIGTRAGRRRAAQHIRWNPWQRILSIFVVMDSPSSKVSTLEAHRERAYSPAEVGRWLMDGGFLIRAVHDAITLRMATGCPQRVIVVARKKLCE